MIYFKYLYLTAFMLSVFSIPLFAEDIIFYKYFQGDGKYATLIYKSSAFHKDPSAGYFISSNLANKSFCKGHIQRKYYKILKTENIISVGKNITQYQLIPKDKHRFKHVLWVIDNKIIKTESFDTDKNLLFVFGIVETHYDKNHKPANPLKCSVEDFGKELHLGFRHIKTKKLLKNITHNIFTDGVSKLSIFIDPDPMEITSISKIVYGNYFFSKVVGGVEYSAIGTLPYESLEKFIDIIASNKDDFLSNQKRVVE